MNGPPKISIIVPTKDRHGTLLEALESIVGQSFQDFEVLIINDGGISPAPLIETHFPGETRFRLLDTFDSCGPGAARNRGLKSSCGAIITYLDDDDVYLPQHLATICSAFDRPEAKPVVYTLAHIIHCTKSVEDYEESRKATQVHRPFAYRKLLSENHIPLICLAHSKERYEDVGGFREDLHQLEDWELLLRLTKDVGATPVDAVTAVYRQLGQRQQVNRIEKDAIETIEKIYALHADAGHVQVRRARYGYLQRIAQMLRTQQRLSLPSSVEHRLRDVSRYLAEEDAQAAEAALRRLVTELPDDGELRLLMARVLRATGRQHEAAAEILELQTRDPYAQPTPSAKALPSWGHQRDCI